jgi:phospholipase/carboxylesterase
MKTRKTSLHPDHRYGQLTVRPQPVQLKGKPGLHEVKVNGTRPAQVFVPNECEWPAPLAVMLHGAGGGAGHGMALLHHLATNRGVIVVAPSSRGATWDIIEGGFGPDVSLIDQVLHHVFSRYPVDARQLAVGGFSDGASYALSLGLTNGRLFTHVLAFSPGFLAPTQQPDSPKIYVSHGAADPILPISRCSRRLVPALRDAGYDVFYHEFAGEHTIPPEVREEAVDWFFGRTRPAAETS